MRVIHLTRVSGVDCWLDADKVVAIERHREGSHVYVGSTSFAVKEAPEAVLELLARPQTEVVIDIEPEVADPT